VKYALLETESALRRIFVPNRDEVTWERRRLHNGQMNDLCTPNSIRVIKSRRIVWNVARIEERRSAYRVLVGEPEGKSHLEDPGVDGRIILK
jgi:uncharacterized protein (DUF2384 family)